MEDRRLTFIVVPDGDLETRTYVVPYRRLKIGLGLALGLVVLVGIVVASWFPVAAQASRVPALVRELEALEGERLRVVELAQTLAEVEAQYERVREMLGADAPPTDDALVLPPLRSGVGPTADAGGDSTMAWPLPVAGFITRSQERPDRQGEHPGLDIAVPAETQVRAAGAGVVIDATEDDIYGNFVRIDHGGGIETVYGHASRVLVRKGDQVARGQLIALAGSSGRSSAPHLHFEVRKDGRSVDPLPFVRQP